jgi:hypothetical protein
VERGIYETWAPTAETGPQSSLDIQYDLGEPSSDASAAAA